MFRCSFGFVSHNFHASCILLACKALFISAGIQLTFKCFNCGWDFRKKWGLIGSSSCYVVRRVTNPIAVFVRACFAVTLTFRICPKVPRNVRAADNILSCYKGTLPDISRVYDFFFDIFGIFELIVEENISAALFKGDSLTVVIGNYIILHGVRV